MCASQFRHLSPFACIRSDFQESNQWLMSEIWGPEAGTLAARDTGQKIVKSADAAAG